MRWGEISAREKGGGVEKADTNTHHAGGRIAEANIDEEEAKEKMERG